MEKLREMVMKLANADQNKPLWPSQIAHIEQQLHSTFPHDLHTPDHPPYTAMIYNAIIELNEEGGSSEESISEYLQANYKDLPFAHKSLLSQHLRKLNDKEFLSCKADDRYMIHKQPVVPDGRKPLLKRKYKMNHVTTPQEYTVCNAVTNQLSLPVLYSKGESSKGLVKRKKKYMKNTCSEENSEEEQMRINKVIDHSERQHLLCLQALVETRFFDECKLHTDANSGNCNSYCFDCMSGALCNSCRIFHTDHTLVRIKRTVWEDAVTTSEILMCIDIAGIQTHLLKGKASVSLKRTIPSRKSKTFTGNCLICKRHLPGSFNFCSLKCKFDHDLASYAPFSAN